MNNPIKIGMVGIGRAGWGMHVPDLEGKEDKFRIVAACDILEERRERMKKRFSCNTYESIEELVCDPEVELVDIATRSCDHYAHACIALEAGKDVVLEKPACVSYEQFTDLLTRANGEGQPRLFFRQNRRFESAFSELKKIIDSGIIGHVFELRLSELGFDFRDDWQTLSKYGGGQMNNWGPHLIDHALQMLGAPVARVSSNLIHGAAGGDCEDHFSICITGENGCFATVSVSGAAALDEGRTYIAYGTRGSAIMKNDDIHVKYIDPEQSIPAVISSEATPGSVFGASGTYESTLNPVWLERDINAPWKDWSEFWIHLYETYRNGAPFPIKTEEVDALMRVIHEAKKNAIVHMV